MQALALLILVAAGGWLIWVGLTMAFRPAAALHVLRLAGSSHRANLTELVPRMVVGLAMMVRADVSKLPDLFEMAGLFVAASSIVILLSPLTWHNGFAVWWADRFSPVAVRAMAPFSAAGGIGLVYLAW